MISLVLDTSVRGPVQVTLHKNDACRSKVELPVLAMMTKSKEDERKNVLTFTGGTVLNIVIDRSPGEKQVYLFAVVAGSCATAVVMIRQTKLSRCTENQQGCSEPFLLKSPRNAQRLLDDSMPAVSAYLFIA